MFYVMLVVAIVALALSLTALWQRAVGENQAWDEVVAYYEALDGLVEALDYGFPRDVQAELAVARKRLGRKEPDKKLYDMGASYQGERVGRS